MKSTKSYILCIKQNELLKKYITVKWIKETYNIKMYTIFMNSEKSKTSNIH